MRFRQGEDGEPLGDVGFQPVGEARVFLSVAGDKGVQFCLCRLQRRRIPYRAQLFSNALSRVPVGRVVHSVPGQVELAALPCGRPEHRTSCGLQASVIIRHDERGPAHTAGLQAFEELTPVHFRLRQLHREPENMSALIGPYALVASHRGKHPDLADWLETDIPEGLAVFSLPEAHRKRMRTSNGIERPIRQEPKRRTVKVRVFPNLDSLLRLSTAGPVEIDEKRKTETKAYIKWEGLDE